MSIVTIEVSDRVAAAMERALTEAAKNTVFGPRRALLHVGIEAIAKARPGGEAVETDDTTCLLDGDGDWWVFKNRFWYCIGGGAEIDHGPESMVGATAFIGLDDWTSIATHHGIQA